MKTFDSCRVVGIVATLSLIFGATVVVQDSHGQPGAVRIFKLADLEKEALHAAPAVAELFRGLFPPADRFEMANGDKIWVAPVPIYLGSNPSFDGFLELQVLDKKPAEVLNVRSSELARATPFEQFALDKIAAFVSRVHVGLTPRRSPDNRLSAVEKWRAADKALQALAWFHESTRSRPLDGPSPWNELSHRLEDKLLEARREFLQALVAEAKTTNQWQEAMSAANRLLDRYPHNPSVGRQIRTLWADRAMDQLKAKDYASARGLWERCRHHFLDGAEARPVQEGLQQQAQAWLEEAGSLADVPARDKLAQALALWPRLPGLRDELLRRHKKYAVLYVGVRRLPEFLSPATAWTDAEKQGLDLVFESLVQPLDQGQGQHYQPRLAAGIPDLHPLYRRFSLRRDAYWSDGERVVPADLRHTVQLMTDASLAGRASYWLNYFEVPHVEGTSFAVDFKLRQGLFDPLSLLSFKVLPQSYRGKPLRRADDADFAKGPVGSGPFTYLGRQERVGRTFAVFAANPQFDRAGRSHQPFLREIRFFAWQDVRDLTTPEARSALLLDVPTDQVAALKKMAPHQFQNLLGRRIYFLALNHRATNGHVTPLTNKSFRRALGLAIDREGILNRCFRGVHVDLELLGPLGAALALPLHPPSPGSGGRGSREFHRILNGPFPPGAWACAPADRIPRDLLDPALAKSLFGQAGKDLGKIKLTLKYPEEDPCVAKACRDIADQVHQLAAGAGATVHLVPAGLPARALKEAIDRRDFELVYSHWDFDSEDFWLWPLFDPQPAAVQPGGSNYLGYDNDGQLQSLFRSALGHRQFSSLREETHRIHAHLVQHMPLVPLWQLHSHLAVPAHLTTGQLDPLRIFSNVCQWQ